MVSNGFAPESSLPYDEKPLAQMDAQVGRMPGSHASEAIAKPVYMGTMSMFNPHDYPNVHYSDGARNYTSPPSRKVRRDSTSSERERKGHADPAVVPLSEQPPPLPAIQPMDAPPVIPTVNNGVPKVKKKGKGRGRGGGLDEELLLAPKPGKGRAATQGVVVPIANAAREEALAEQALKRKRMDGDEPMDDTDEQILQGLLTKETVETALMTTKKKKAEGKAKREHHACDRCFRNKTKCHRQVDGKQPSKHFPCDYCTSINGICTTAVAGAMKPDSIQVAEESHWKLWKFKDIITNAMEEDNLRLRKDLAGFEERFSHQQRLHESLKAELESERAHKCTLEKALQNSYSFVTSREREIATLQKAIRDLCRKRDRMKSYVKQIQGSRRSMIDFSAKTGSAASMSLVRAFALEDDDPKKPETSGPPSSLLSVNISVEQALAEQMVSEATSDALAQVTVGINRESGSRDVFQAIRSREVPCNDMTELNEYIKAYFANVHPLLPVLHKEAFYRLYRLYGLKAKTSEARRIVDASTRDGRAVALICGVLALGALSLVETRNPTEGANEGHVNGSQDKGNQSAPIRHFDEALGFYSVCLRLLTYKHDTLETMIVYLFMGIFAIQLTDVKEAFRKLQNFQTQALGINLSRALDDMDPMELYDQDLWPGVTNLIVSEMAKRAYTMFKLYLSNVALELGRSPNFDDSMNVGSPAEIDDDVVGFEAISIEEYASTAPNPVRFLLALQNLSIIVEEYSTTSWMRKLTTRYAQLNKYRSLWSDLAEWRRSLPSYLDWTKYNSALSTHVYLKMQRPFLETQFQCLMMKVSWSIAHLDPLMLAKFQSIWDVGDANAETLKAAERVLQIIDETGVGSDSYRFYHWEAIRVTMTLSQMLLRHDTVEGRVSMENLINLCRQGLQLCRKMVPDILTRVEDALQQALDDRLESVRNGSLPKLTDLGIDTSMDMVEDPPFPYDNPGMVFIKGALEGDHEGLFLGGRMDEFAYGYNAYGEFIDG